MKKNIVMAIAALAMMVYLSSCIIVPAGRPGYYGHYHHHGYGHDHDRGYRYGPR